ncbi:MAG: hypothetical protein RR140_00345 [Clostridia bacterium]
MNICCRKTQCAFNKDFVCQKKGICINNTLNCLSFKKDGSKAPDTTLNILEKPPKYSASRHIQKMNLECKAHCLFNEKGKCNANGITINSINEKPFCITFLKND